MLSACYLLHQSGDAANLSWHIPCEECFQITTSQQDVYVPPIKVICNFAVFIAVHACETRAISASAHDTDSGNNASFGADLRLSCRDGRLKLLQ